MNSADTLSRGLLSRIDTSVEREVPSFNDDYLETSPGLRAFPTKLTGLGLPSVRLSTSPIADEPSSIYDPQPIPTNIRARNESRKLFSHVLRQLAHRKKPPSVTDTNNDTNLRGFGTVAGTLKDFVKLVPDSKRVTIQNDSDDEENRDFSTDETFDLMVQLKDVLTMSIAQGWRIFDDDGVQVQDSMSGVNPKFSSTFRRPRNSFRPGGKRSRPSSHSNDDVHVPELLSLCVSILASVITEDCKYKIALPRPSRPPNALQILTLNIAQFLIHVHHHDPRVISQITFAMIPAFSVFPPQMHNRLLYFFETSIVSLVLQDLERLQGLSAKGNLSEGGDVDSVGLYEGPTVSIQIDEILLEGEVPPQHDGPLFTPSMQGEAQSRNYPHQSLHVYYLTCLIPPLLSAILDSIEANREHGQILETVLRLDNLLTTMSTSKIDTYNDLLEIIAYHGPKSRRLAISFMAKFWPKATGHTSISSPLCAPLQPNFQLSKYTHAHQFVPWHSNFDEGRLHPNVMSYMECRSCTNPLRGFVLICPLCMCAVHFDCYDYPEGNYQIQYSMSTDVVQRLAMYRFSDLGVDTLAGHTAISEGHDFRPVNWFTLCLCYACQKPLWGCIAQGLRCRLCSVSLHFGCLASLGHTHPCEAINFTSMHMTISWKNLRNSCLAHFSPVLRLTRDQLNGCSREEISIYHAVFRTQLQLLTSGIAMGSIIIAESGTDTLYNPNHEIAKFELSQFTNWCDQLLDSHELPCSPLTQQFLQENNVRRIDRSLMHEWSYLEYICSNLKMSLPQGHSTRAAPEFLNINQAIGTDNHVALHSYECISLSHMRDILRTDFAVQSDHAAKFILDHLHHLCFFDRIDREFRPFNDLPREKEVRCIFPLPFGLDISTNVESLVSSVEACLSDLDLSSNEFGFLLLTRRLWPNRLVSEYGLKRLAGRVLGWILKEDDSLATVLREFVAKNKQLPGVRSDADILPWPPSPDFRPGTVASLSSNGGDYVTARHSLLSRFAAPWLLELHELDPVLYGQVVFETCSEVADDQLDAVVTGVYTSNKTRNTKFSRHCESLLRSIIKLCHTSVIFSAFDSVFIRWIELASRLEQLIPSLQRLIGNESESSQHLSTIIDSISSTSDKPHLPLIDPLHAILSLASQSEDDLSRSLLYFSTLTKSGVNIPTSFLVQFSKLMNFNGPNSLNNADTLLKAILLCLWQTSIGRQELESLISMLHSRLANQVLECLLSGNSASVALSIIRHSLAACLRLYGCEKSSIRDAGIVAVTEVQQLPSRRKLSTQRSVAVDPVIIDAKIMTSLELYLGSGVEDVSCLMAKFLNMFLTESPFLEVFEADNFILRNGKVLASCIWISYGVQQEDIATVRTNLLLRSLIVDSNPFQDILLSCFNHLTSPFQQRLSGVNRLFRIISDVTSPAFNVEGRQWRSSVIEIFYHYFTALWADPTEEVRLAVQSSSAALLPAHWEVISQCWNESLSKAPIAERIRLVNFLIQLRPHFPSWKVLSWDVIVETLMEYDDDPHGGDDLRIHSPTNRYGGTPDPETTLLRVSTLLLSLQMIADGIEIDGFSLMKLNFQYLKITGFTEVSITPAQNGHSFHMDFGDVADVPGSAFPCIEELVHVVDAAYFVDLPHVALGLDEEQEEETSRVLIGTIFIDPCLSMINNLSDLTCLPVLTLKSLLEILYILIHKYDFENNLLQHLQTSLRRSVLRTIELLSQDISYEIRQLSLSIAQVCIKRWHSLLGATVSGILELVAGEIASQHQNNQDPLLLQCKLFIGNTLQSFANSGLLFSLMRRSLKEDFFLVLKQVLPGKEKPPTSDLCDILLRDTFSRAAECDSASFQTVVVNIHKFIEIVHFQRYSADMMIFVGQQLTNLVRRLSDGTIDGADASPLIYIAIILVRNNKRNGKDLLPYIDIVLRVALNRLHLDAACLSKLISVTTPQRSKAQESTQGVVDIVSVLFDILGDGIRMKTKTAPSTTKILIEALVLTENGPLTISGQRSLLSNLADDAVSFIYYHSWHDDLIENDFGAAIATGKLLLGAAQNYPVIFQKIAEYPLDKPSRYSYGIRSWNVLLLASFQEVHDGWRSMLYSHFLTFMNAYSTLVRGYVQAGISSPETATADVNQLHISMKLWLILVQSLSRLAVGETQIFTVWNELWLAQESFLNILEMEAQAGLYPTVISLASTSIVDILMYVRSLHSPLALDTSIHVTILNRLRVLNRGDSTSSKVERAIRFMSETAPEVADRILLDQIVKELMAAEKLRMVETKGRLR